MTDAALTPTPNDCDLPRICAQFATFNEAIDYAARSLKGLNFHDMRGELAIVYPYRQMREDALVMARRLVAAGIGKEDRVALIAETGATGIRDMGRVMAALKARHTGQMDFGAVGPMVKDRLS